MIKTRVQQKVYELFSLNEKRISPKGWMMSPKACPWCGKDNEHFGIKFTERTVRHNNEVSFRCLKCDVTGGEFLLFKQLDLLTFLRQGDYIKQDKALEKRINTKDDEEETLVIDVPTRHHPFGFRRVQEDSYLQERGFEAWQFDSYVIGRTKLFGKLKDYVIFLIIEDGENKGYVARITWSKEKIKSHESRTGKRVVRYNNEGGVDFAKLLFGIDEVDVWTKTVILVEGVTDKANIDRFLKTLGLIESTKCCCTFGKKISPEQTEKLRVRGVESIVFLYDPDAISSSKQYSMSLSKKFGKVLVGFLRDKDPGDLCIEEFSDVMNKLEDPMNFSINKLQKRELKVKPKNI